MHPVAVGFLGDQLSEALDTRRKSSFLCPQSETSASVSGPGTSAARDMETASAKTATTPIPFQSFFFTAPGLLLCPGSRD